MKRNSYPAVVLAFAAFSLAAGAMPVYESNQGREYLISYQGLDRWGAGVVFSSLERPVVITSGRVEMESSLEQDRVMGYLTYHLLRAMDIYVIGGGANVGLDGWKKESADSDYGVGLRLNIMDHIIQDPILLEDKIRLSATLQYSETKIGEAWGAKKAALREKYAAVSMAVINDVEGMVLFHPESIALNLSFIYSGLDGHLDYPASRADIEADDTSYLTAGVEMFWTKRVSIEVFALLSGGDTTGSGAALHVRF
jgi:hypothetical protein